MSIGSALDKMSSGIALDNFLWVGVEWLIDRITESIHDAKEKSKVNDVSKKEYIAFLQDLERDLPDAHRAFVRDLEGYKKGTKKQFPVFAKERKWKELLQEELKKGFNPDSFTATKADGTPVFPALAKLKEEKPEDFEKLTKRLAVLYSEIRAEIGRQIGTVAEQNISAQITEVLKNQTLMITFIESFQKGYGFDNQFIKVKRECPNCGRENPEGVEICQHCGHELKIVNVERGDKFSDFTREFGKISSQLNSIEDKIDGENKKIDVIGKDVVEIKEAVSSLVDEKANRLHKKEGTNRNSSNRKKWNKGIIIGISSVILMVCVFFFILGLKSCQPGGTTGDSGGSAATVIVTFDDVDDPTFSIDGDSIKTIKAGQTYGSLPSCSRKGYRFIGWYTAKYGGIRICEDSNVVSSNDHTVYPRFEAYTYTVSFVNQSGASVASQTVPFGSTITLEEPSHAYGDYYTFTGWSDGEEKYNFTYTVTEDKDVALSATWAQTYADYTYIFTAYDFGWHIGNNLGKSDKPANCGAGKYMLLNDIDLGSWIEGWGYTKWTANNASTTLNGETCFSGIFDGQGHTISYVTRIGTTDLRSWAFGLFPVTDGATIKNLNVNADLSTFDPKNRNEFYDIHNNDRAEDAMVGGLVGYARNTTIENCNASGNINYNSEGGGGDTCVAGLVGYAYNSTIKNCSSSALVFGRGFYISVAGVVACYYDTIISGLHYELDPEEKVGDRYPIVCEKSWLAGERCKGIEVARNKKVL